MGNKFVLLQLLHALLIEAVSSQQYFRVRPHDTSVVAGRTAELHCHIGNRAGLVQWSKDGFLLGYDPQIPGYARYEMQVDHPNSAYTLLVHEARLDDEGEFQCQVGPGKNEKPIRSVARLTVLVPPESLTVNGLSNGSDVEVREGEKLVLTCQAVSSKPATILKWFRKNVELMPEASRTSVRRESEKLYTTVSSITLYPKGEVAGVSYSCEAIHPGLTSPWRTTVGVQVLYPPSPPEIEGFREGDVAQAGDTLLLTCISKGGKPPARLVWYRNGDILEGRYLTIGRDATNSVELIVRPDDNNAIFGCTAVNPLTPRPLLKTIKLNVLFPPTTVYLDGPHEAHRGESVTVTCRTDASNPPAEITWLVDGQPIEAQTTSTIGDNGKWYTTSRVTATISRQDTELKSFSCYAVGIPQHDAVFRSQNVTIIHPPEMPLISGYYEGDELRSGQVHEFTCTAVAGYPPADLKWFRGDSEVTSQVTLSTGRLISKLTIETEPSDNGISLRCEVNNSAVSKPLRSELKLTVLFPPANVTITADPSHPKEGDKVRLECWSSSSNPATKIVWWQNGRLLSTDDEWTVRSMNGGFASGGTLSLHKVTSGDDGSRFSCEAKSEAFESSVEDRFILRIRYAPIFLSFGRLFDMVEGQSGEINATARAFPEVNLYTWYKDQYKIPNVSPAAHQKQRVSSNRALLYFREIIRNDAGEYSCMAENSEGKASTTMRLNVLYSATILNVTGQKEVAQGDTVSWTCSADGNPMTEKAVSWRRKDNPKILIGSATPNGPGRSVLTIMNVTRTHAGVIECVADNGIGSPSTHSVKLVVMYRPNVLKENLKRRVATGNRTTAELTCGAEGYPEVTFTWSYNGTTIASAQMESEKYWVRGFPRKEQEWWSTLVIRAVELTDLGVYTCVAANEMGHDFTTFTLAKTGVPDRPEMLEAKNISHRGATLTWRPGFDGGTPQTFWLRYRDLQESNYTFVEIARNVSFFKVMALRQGTVYEFALAAKNQLGESAFTSVLRIRTKNLPVMDSTVSQLDFQGASSDILPTWLLVAAVIGGIVVVANVFVCVTYVRRKSCFRGRGGGPRPDIEGEDNDPSREKKILKKKKISSVLEEESPPFYLSGTTVDLPEDALDLSNFQKSPTNPRQISHESSEDGHSSGSRRCDWCDGRQWGICGSGSPSRAIPSHEHRQCPDLLKRDSCHCRTSKLATTRSSVDADDPMAASQYCPQQEKVDEEFFASPQQQMILTTFQSKTELPIRHSLLDVVMGPKLETMINGDSEES